MHIDIEIGSIIYPLVIMLVSFIVALFPRQADHMGDVIGLQAFANTTIRIAVALTVTVISWVVWGILA